MSLSILGYLLFHLVRRTFCLWYFRLELWIQRLLMKKTALEMLVKGTTTFGIYIPITFNFHYSICNFYVPLLFALLSFFSLSLSKGMHVDNYLYIQLKRYIFQASDQIVKVFNLYRKGIAYLSGSRS